MSKIFIASHGVLFAGNPIQHLYLVKDEDGVYTGTPNATGDEWVIRGGPENKITFNGNIMLEVNIKQGSSDDALDGETPASRNYTELNIIGALGYALGADGFSGADGVWNKMMEVAQNMGNFNATTQRYLTTIPYQALTVNSNSTIHSILSAVGIDPFGNLPMQNGTGTRISATSFPAFPSIFGTLRNLPGMAGNAIDAVMPAIPANEYRAINIYDQGGDTVIKVAANNNLLLTLGGLNNGNIIWLDNDFATQEVIQLSGIAANKLKPLRNGDDLLLQNADTLANAFQQTIATIKDFFSGAATGKRLNYLEIPDGAGQLAKACRR
jgi:hypothetical protein